MVLLPIFLFLLFLLVPIIDANTEKTIFIAPPKAVNAARLSSFLSQLTPSYNVKRTYIPVIFPPDDHLNAGKPAGTETWFFLNQLRPGQRHEVRVCWAATQPTEFWLHTFTIDEIRESPALNASLEEFIASKMAETQKRQPDSIPPDQSPGYDVQTIDTSSLFLRVTAAADYFTPNETLMLHPEPVLVDLILDPFLGNIFPRSLVPVGIYISIVAVIAWFMSGLAWRFLSGIADAESVKEEKKND